MGGDLSRQHSRHPLRSARARLRKKAQITLPEDIRRALRVGEGDELEFTVWGDGSITVRGFVSIPTDQLWLYAPQQDGVQTVDEAAGHGTMHESAEAMFGYLDAMGSADA